MPNPRFTPRYFAVNPSDFGQQSEIAWKETRGLSDTEVDQLVAAQLQHRYAHLIRQKAFAYSSLKECAGAIGIKEARLGDILRGSILMRIEDIAMVHRTLGIRIEF